jgi:hypothetical protein
MYKIKTNASRIGLRDGRDAFLLERKMKNPYDPFSMDFIEYENAWKQGYEEEENNCL